MSPARFRIRAAAAREVDAAYRWYERQRPGLGREFLAEVDRAFAALRAAPEQYPIVQGRTRRLLLTRFPYGVFFRASVEEIVVAAVVHSRRDPWVWHRRAEG